MFSNDPKKSKTKELVEITPQKPIDLDAVRKNLHGDLQNHMSALRKNFEEMFKSKMEELKSNSDNNDSNNKPSSTLGK